MSPLRSILFFCLLAPALCPAQNAQPNPDSVRAQRARMIAQASEEYKNRVFFNLPLVLKNDQVRVRILLTEEWKSTDLKGGESALFNDADILKMYYIGVKPVKA